MNLRSLQYFLIAAEEENVTKAAERLYISQQALSVHIRRLEEEYGVTLFERKPFFRLTEAGRRMVEYSRYVLSLEEDLRSDFSDLDIHAKGLLRVGMSRLRINAFFPSIWEKYYREHPNISIDLLDGNRSKLSDLLASGKLDLYIALDIPENPAFVTYPLYEERSICIFRKTLLQQYYPDTWELLLEDMKINGASLPKLKKLPFIVTRTDNVIRRDMDQLLPRDVNLSFILETNLQQMICSLSLKGYGIGVVSPASLYTYSFTASFFPGADELCVFPLEKTMGNHKCSLVFRRDWNLPRYARDFIDDVRSSFREYEQFMQDHFSL